MLPTHGRYDFSAITQRPVYNWPTGKRLAVYVALNIEHFAWGEGKGSAIAPAGQHAPQSVYSWRDYGNRVGFWRMMEMFDDLDIPVQAQLNTAVYEHCPAVVERLRRRGDEILGHGITNSEEQGLLPEDAERSLIETATGIIAREEGAPPAGWMTPWLSESDVTLDLLKECGYRYVLDWACDDQPIWLKTRAGPILAVPYPVEINDNRAIVFHKYSAAEFADMIIANFDEMLEQSEGQPLVFGISLHPFAVGQPFRMRELRRAMRHIADHRDRIWLTQPGKICTHIEGLPPGTVPGA